MNILAKHFGHNCHDYGVLKFPFLSPLLYSFKEFLFVYCIVLKSQRDTHSPLTKPHTDKAVDISHLRGLAKTAPPPTQTLENSAAFV